MLNRERKTVLATHTFLVSIELANEVDPRKISLRLADSVAFIEGVGETSVDYQGVIEKGYELPHA